MNTAPVSHGFLHYFEDADWVYNRPETEAMVDETSVFDQERHHGFELMVKPLIGTAVNRIDPCESCVQALRRLERYDRLLGLTYIEAAFVLDAIDEALNEVIELNERTLQRRPKQANMTEKDVRRAQTLATTVCALISQVTEKLKVQMDQRRASF